jgi:phage-related protein
MADGSRTIKIKFASDVAELLRGVAAAQASLRSLDGDGSKFSKNFSKSFGSMTKGAANLAVTMGQLSSGVTVLSGLAGWAASASGAIGLLPGAIAIAGAAMVTMKLGADGIKKAWAGTFDPLKAAVSDTFQRTMVPAVNNVKALLPQLSGGFKGIATEVSGVATKFTAMLRQKENVNSLNAILFNTKDATKNLGAAVAPLGQAFLDVASVGSAMFAELTGGAGGAAQRFADFIHEAKESGKLHDWIQTGIDAFKQLGAILADVFGIIGDVFRGLNAGAEGSISPLAAVLDTIHQFTSSVEGQEALRGLGEAMRAVGGAVSTVLGAALKAIAPLIPPLASAFSNLATTVASILVPVIQFLAPILLNIANFIAQNTSWITPLVIALGVWAAAQTVLNFIMAANPISLVILAIAALIAIIAAIITHLDFFRGIWDAVWKFCSDIISGVVDWVKGKWDWLMAVFDKMLENIKDTWNSAWKWVSDVVTRAVDIWKGLIGGAVDWIKRAWQGIGDFIGGVFNGIVGGIKSAINAVLRVINSAIHGVNNITSAVGIPGIPDIPMLAKGGTAFGGKSYLVGERGPELFTPGATGRVTNARTTAEAMGGGGSQVINLAIDLGEGIQQRVSIALDDHDNATVRSATAGTGRYR